MKDILNLRFAGGIVALMSCVSLGWALQTANWKDYPYASDGFSVSSTSEPGVSKQTVKSPAGDVEVHFYAMPLRGDTGFMIVASALHPDDRRTPQQVLTDAKRGALDSVKAKLLSEKPASIGDYPGVEVDFEAEKYHGRTRIYSVGRMLYQIMVIAPTAQPLPDETSRFYDSFRLLNAPK